MPAYEDAVNIIEELGIKITELSNFPKEYDVRHGCIKIDGQHIAPTLLEAIKKCGEFSLKAQGIRGTLSKCYEVFLRLDHKVLNCSSEGGVDKKTRSKLEAITKEYGWTLDISEDTGYCRPSS